MIRESGGQRRCLQPPLPGRARPVGGLGTLARVAPEAAAVEEARLLVPVAPVNEADTVLLPEGLKALKRVAQLTGLGLQGSSLNFDGGLASKSNRKGLFNAGLMPRHPDLAERFAAAIEILSVDSYNRSREHAIRKLERVRQGRGQYRLRLGRWRFRYDNYQENDVFQFFDHKAIPADATCSQAEGPKYQERPA